MVWQSPANLPNDKAKQHNARTTCTGLTWLSFVCFLLVVQSARQHPGSCAMYKSVRTWASASKKAYGILVLPRQEKETRQATFVFCAIKTKSILKNYAFAQYHLVPSNKLAVAQLSRQVHMSCKRAEPGCAQTEPATKGMMIQSAHWKICSVVCSSALSYSATARNLYSKHLDSPESEFNFTGKKLLNAQCSLLGHVSKECQKALLLIKIFKILGINSLVGQYTYIPISLKRNQSLKVPPCLCCFWENRCDLPKLRSLLRLHAL